ncbi:MAG TPA: hypothetical protein EYH56_00620 [Nanoarchaeota archaeon]|nr:hypothetical protein [Nanoarchaeota archaeon]
MKAYKIALFFLIFSVVLHVFSVLGLISIDISGNITEEIETQKEQAEDTGGVFGLLQSIPFVGDLILALKKLSVVVDLFKSIFAGIYNIIIAIFGDSPEVVAIAVSIQAIVDFIYIIGLIQFLTNRNLEY